MQHAFGGPQCSCQVEGSTTPCTRIPLFTSEFCKPSDIGDYSFVQRVYFVLGPKTSVIQWPICLVEQQNKFWCESTRRMIEQTKMTILRTRMQTVPSTVQPDQTDSTTHSVGHNTIVTKSLVVHHSNHYDNLLYITRMIRCLTRILVGTGGRTFKVPEAVAPFHFPSNSGLMPCRGFQRWSLWLIQMLLYSAESVRTWKLWTEVWSWPLTRVLSVVITIIIVWIILKYSQEVRRGCEFWNNGEPSETGRGWFVVPCELVAWQSCQ